MKCLSLDKNLKAIALASRSFTDRLYMMDILLNILAMTTAKSPSARSGDSSSGKKSALERVLAIANTSMVVANRIFRSYILVDILAVLPVPQVVIFSFFSKMRSSRSSETRKFLDSLVLLQYVPRVLRIFLLCNERHLIPRKAGIWIKSVFNFFLYILASHVLGAVWYYFSILKETACWQSAYRSQNQYEHGGYGCDDHHTSRNVTLLNGLCPTNPPNPTLFDFGVFTDAFLSGMLGSTNFPQKFLICFWWGLRNLSSLGQNLQPSTNAWENLFAVSISIIGLLLFLYLIGNLQTYLQFGTTRAEEIRRRTKTKDLEVDLWLSRKGIPNKVLKKLIMQTVERRIEENKDVQVENILSLLPVRHSNLIRHYMRLATLKKVPMLQRMDERLLREICTYLKSVTYEKEHPIMEEGRPLDKMFFIRQGMVRTYRIHKGDKVIKFGNSKVLEQGDLYGEELLNRISSFTSSSDLPNSTRFVRSLNKVEVFALEAEDLKKVVNKCWWHFTKDKILYQYYNKDQLNQLKRLAASAIQRQVTRIKTLQKNKSAKGPQMVTGQGNKKRKLGA
ncbi:cyclic nucleotide-gated ion channel 1-like [Rosa rugosa]|uniref:cyclic nucleotide-gated ion channel 1-like n=1 Tax=Rosa rugosa TaxID=74645 RepID=UPI002B408CCA|nr:cyclic nucleotide-gated ion channel 1-like [Rosa rugosa]